MDILQLMYQRMWQLQGRIIEIQNYVKREGKVISKRDFTLDDIPKLKNQVQEMSVGISAIEKFRRESKKKLTDEQNPDRSVATDDAILTDDDKTK
jgi:hypothetical protein